MHPQQQNRPCASPGCDGNASSRCVSPDGLLYCSTHCSCGQHSKRKTRAGPVRGRRGQAAQRRRRLMHTAFAVVQEAAEEFVMQRLVHVPSRSFPSWTALRASLIRATTASLLYTQHSLLPGDATTYAQLVQLSWHTLQRLKFAVNVDLVNGVSSHAAVQPPGPSQVSESEDDPATGSVVGTADSGGASSSAAPADIAARLLQCPPGLALAAPPSSELRPTARFGMPLRVSLASLTSELQSIYVQLSRSFQLASLPSEPTPAALCYQEGGTFLWNETLQCPVAAACRHTGVGPVVKVQGSSWSSLEQWVQNGNAVCISVPEQAAALASQAFHHFWQARRHLSTRISAWQVETPPFADPSCGTWLRGRMSSLSSERPNMDDRIGWHGTSLHAISRVAAQGLENGWSGIAVRGSTKLGVYYHIQQRAHLCMNYVVYSALEQDSGFVFAPVVQMRAPAHDPQCRTQHLKRPSGRHQELTYEDVCVATDIWIHVRHVLEVYDGAADGYIHAEGCFDQSLETDAILPRQTLMARAKARCRRP